ncbi:hypothetical protein J2P12_07320 [Candidatus Bathyarchaeota archaeon]|nr:hypothetical protein [Candidatus Bathyarchaeota archaeon]
MFLDTFKRQAGKFYSKQSLSRAGILLILLLAAVPAFAHIPLANAAKPQPPPTTTSTNWAKTYFPQGDTYGASVAKSVSQISSGGYLVGMFCDASSCNGGAGVMRVDSSGNIQSQTQYEFTNYPFSTTIELAIPTSDGGSLFTGNMQFGCPAQGQSSCALIVKVDSKGNIQWSNDLEFGTTCTSGPFAWPLDAHQTSDGGYVLTGYSYTPTCSAYGAFVVKLSTTGQLQWQRLFTDPTGQGSIAEAIHQTSDGGYAVAGETYTYVNDSYTETQPLAFKLDSTGSIVWQHVYSLGVDTYAQTMALTNDGGLIIGGTVDIPAGTSYSSPIFLLKLDSAGNPQFAKTYLPTGSISELTITAAQQTSDGGYAFSGYYFQNTVYDQRAFIVKTDPNGNVQWDKIYGADVEYSDRGFNSFQQTSDGGYVAAGFTNQFSGGGSNVLWLVKTDSNGNISGCSDIHSDSSTTSSLTVNVSKSNLSAAKDTFSYVAEALAVYTGPLAATKEC